MRVMAFIVMIVYSGVEEVIVSLWKIIKCLLWAPRCTIQHCYINILQVDGTFQLILLL